MTLTASDTLRAATSKLRDAHAATYDDHTTETWASRLLDANQSIPTKGPALRLLLADWLEGAARMAQDHNRPYDDYARDFISQSLTAAWQILGSDQ